MVGVGVRGRTGQGRAGQGRAGQGRAGFMHKMAHLFLYTGCECSVCMPRVKFF